MLNFEGNNSLAWCKAKRFMGEITVVGSCHLGTKLTSMIVSVWCKVCVD